jgi:large subunit ribosomal protein L10
MANPQKVEQVKKVKEILDKAKCVLVFNLSGVDANSLNELRSEFRNNESIMHVSKNTLMKIAVNDTDYEQLKDLFTQQTAYVATAGDPVVMAKVLDEFAKKFESVSIKGGVLDCKYLEADQIIELAKLPSRKELIAKLLMTMNAPLTGFINVLAGSLRQVLYVLNAIKEQKQNN